MEALQQSGIALIQALQTFSPALDGVMNFFSFLGRIEFYLLILSFIYWAIDKRLGFRLVVILVTISLLGGTLKLLLHQPRPYWLGGVKALSNDTGYGIPSGHAYSSAAVWGYLAYRLKKAWLWIVVVAVVLLIGLSRMYLGVHFPHDVVAGWLFGAVMVSVFVKSEGAVATTAKQWSVMAQIAIGFGISLIFSAVGPLVQVLLSGTPDPAAWAGPASQARDPSYSFLLGGALFGTLSGHVLMKQFAPFDSEGTWTRRVGRYALGIAGLLLIYLSLNALISSIADNASTLGFILRYIEYAAVTFWLFFVAPLVFLRLKLADRLPG